MSDDYGFMENLKQAQILSAKSYIKKATSFIIGYPEGKDKLHVMLVETQSGEMLKQINCAKFLLSNESDELLSFFKNMYDKEQPHE